MKMSGRSKVTLKEVAAQAGVSTSAVSRTFTPGASVSIKTRHRVEMAAKALGYEPNLLARSLTTGQTGLIGVVANNFHNPIYLEVFDLMTRELQLLGLKTLVVNLTDETHPANSIQMLQQYQVDGVIVASSTLPQGFAEGFAASGIPTVHAFGRPGGALKMDVVGIDNVEAGRMAARRLLKCGYKSVGFLGGPEQASSTKDRLQGFLDVVGQHTDIKAQVNFAGDYSFEAGFNAMASLVLRGLSEGYFCGDDVISIGAMSALQKAGRRVPEDVGLIGFNDMEISGWENVRLTTVAQPLDQIIKHSVAKLSASLNSNEVQSPSTTLLPCLVVERDTLPVTT